MALVDKSVLIMRTPEQMFALVDHVEDYPKFLPWCGGVESVADVGLLSAEAASPDGETVTIDAAFVDGRLANLAKSEDLARYVL